MNQYDAIVIGTGIGGLAEGLLLAHAGKKVALFEKNDILGGRFCSWKKDGFTLDMGVQSSLAVARARSWKCSSAAA